MSRRLSGLKKNITHPDFLRVLILRTIGNFLVLFSLFMIFKTFYQPVREEVRFFIDGLNKKQYVVAESVDAATREPQLAKLVHSKKVEILTPKDPQFSIIIPKIAANANIIANVNAADENGYLEALKTGVAHVAGTDFPGEGGHIYLFAHSTDYFWNVGTYNAVFYLLTKLEAGDEIDLFYKGARYIYKVDSKEIVDPDKIDYLTRKTNEEFLTLQTCWPAGTTLKRLLVFAKRVVE